MKVSNHKKDSTMPLGISPARRAFLRDALAMAPAAAAAGTGMLGATLAKTVSAAGAPAYRPAYFSSAEWTTLNALVDRLIPADQLGPGALEAGVPEFIDLQMNLPYGYGALWYMHAPFVKGASLLMGYQLEFSPRTMYRSALAGFEQAVQALHKQPFNLLDEAAKDALIADLEHGTLRIGDVPPVDFFTQLLQNTHEGYFCDPKHGGNKNMAAWRMINFPGARGDYTDWVEQYGKHYPLGPVSIG
jgi:gluconate 2-dehydrogenase gamma chain